MATQTFELIRTGSVVSTDTPITKVVNQTTAGVVTTITLPPGTTYDSHTASLGTLDITNPLVPIWNIISLPKDVEVVLDIFVKISDEVAFSAGSRDVVAVTATLPGEVDIINNTVIKPISGTTCGDIGSCDNALGIQNGLIFGGAVWTAGLSYDVSKVRFVIEGIIYDAAAATVVLAAADPVDPRIDVIVADINGVISVVTGIPAAIPVKPEIDLFTQVEITFATVSALATTPDGVSTNDVYQENAGNPAEWNATENTGGARVNLASGASAYAGALGIITSSIIFGDAIDFVPTAPIATSGISSLAFRIKAVVGQPWSSDARLTFQFFSGVFPASDKVVLQDGPQWNSGNPSDWVLFIFDRNDWNFNAVSVDMLRISAAQGSIDFHMDAIVYLSGIPIPPTSSAFKISDGTNSFDVSGGDTILFNSGDSTISANTVTEDVVDLRVIGSALDNVYNKSDSTTASRTITVPEPFNFTIDGVQGATHDFLVQGFDGIRLFSDTGAAQTATLFIDWDATCRLTYQGTTYKTEFEATTNNMSMDLSGGGSAANISLFSTDSGKIALEANVYRFGDGAGNNIPVVDDVSRYDVVVDPSNGHIGITARVETINIESFDGSQAVSTGDGVKAITIPAYLNGWNLTNVVVSVEDKGVTATTDVVVRRWRGGAAADMLSTAVTIGDEWFAEDGVIDVASDDVLTGDRIYVDINSVHSGTAPNGLSTVLEFTKQ